MKKSKITGKYKDNIWGYFFIFPQLLGFTLFALAPIIVVFILAFTSWNFIQPMSSVKNTSIFTLGIIPLTLVSGLFVALLLKKPARFNNIYKTALFLPFVTASAAVSLVWYWMLAPDVGLINAGLSYIGITGPEWLRDPVWAKISIIIYLSWTNLGYAYLIFGAGLGNIPEEYYQAARIDGASRWREFRHITLPLISPITFFLMVTLMISTFNLFGEIYIITAGTGGPVFSTYTIVLYIYSLAFSFFRMGDAAVVSIILFAILFLLTFINFRFSKRWVHYLD